MVAPFTALDAFPESKVHVTNMGPTWVLSAPGRPHAGPMNFAIRYLSPRVYIAPEERIIRMGPQKKATSPLPKKIDGLCPI